MKVLLDASAYSLLMPRRGAVAALVRRAEEVLVHGLQAAGTVAPSSSSSISLTISGS